MLNVKAQVRRAATLATRVNADWRKRQTGNPEELLEDRKIKLWKRKTGTGNNWKEQVESVILPSASSPTHITQHSSQLCVSNTWDNSSQQRNYTLK